MEGSDINSASAYIDREVVLASNNALGTAETGADGRFRLSGIPECVPRSGGQGDCSPGFGASTRRRVLNVNTALAPSFSGGLNFEIPPST